MPQSSALDILVFPHGCCSSHEISCSLFYLAALVAAVSRPADCSHETVGGGALPGKRLVRKDVSA
jgi:hypothetical protein